MLIHTACLSCWLGKGHAHRASFHNITLSVEAFQLPKFESENHMFGGCDLSWQATEKTKYQSIIFKWLERHHFIIQSILKNCCACARFLFISLGVAIFQVRQKCNAQEKLHKYTNNYSPNCLISVRLVKAKYVSYDPLCHYAVHMYARVSH